MAILLVLAVAYSTRAAHLPSEYQVPSADGVSSSTSMQASGSAMAVQHTQQDESGSAPPAKLLQRVGRLLLDHAMALNTSTVAGLIAGPSNSNDSCTGIVNVPGLPQGTVIPSNKTAAMERYCRQRRSRIMLLLADVAFLVYAAGGFSQRLFALLLPIVRVGQTGELILTAASVLNIAQLVADLVARLGDLIAKFFLLFYRAFILAATLPPAK